MFPRQTCGAVGTSHPATPLWSPCRWVRTFVYSRLLFDRLTHTVLMKMEKPCKTILQDFQTFFKYGMSSQNLLPEVGIYKRKQESKKTRKQELEQESDQEIKKTRKKTRTRPRKRPRKNEKFFFSWTLSWSSSCFAWLRLIEIIWKNVYWRIWLDGSKGGVKKW